VPVGLGGEPVPEDGSGDPGHGLAEPPAALTAAHRFPAVLAGVGEAQVLDRDGGDVVPLGVADEADDGVPDLGVTAGGDAGEAELDPLGASDWVAVRVEAADGEVPVIEVHRHDRPGSAHHGIGCLRGGAGCLAWWPRRR